MTIQQDSRWSTEIQWAPLQNETKQANEHTACSGRSVAGGAWRCGTRQPRVAQKAGKWRANCSLSSGQDASRGFHLGSSWKGWRKPTFASRRGGSRRLGSVHGEKWIAWKLCPPHSHQPWGEFSLREKF